jgi:hypothetical protein
VSVVYVYGTFGLEFCSPGTSCAASSVCNQGCHSNTWWCAYPHFHECDSHNCNVKTALPKPLGACHTGLIGFRECPHHSVFNFGELQECGPSRHSATAATCAPGKTAEAIACANSALFHQTCACNPLVAGIGWTKFWVST